MQGETPTGHQLYTQGLPQTQSTYASTRDSRRRSRSPPARGGAGLHLLLPLDPPHAQLLAVALLLGESTRVRTRIRARSRSTARARPWAAAAAPPPCGAAPRPTPPAAAACPGARSTRPTPGGPLPPRRWARAAGRAARAARAAAACPCAGTRMQARHRRGSPRRLGSRACTRRVGAARRRGSSMVWRRRARRRHALRARGSCSVATARARRRWQACSGLGLGARGERVRVGALVDGWMRG
eukprot:scaffold47650_cov60-Phaeocystis_antarctica.AAC.1